MIFSTGKILFCAIIGIFCLKSVQSIKCFQCSGTDSAYPFQCNEFLDDNDLLPDSCDSVYGAQYCIKHVGRFEAEGILCYQCTSNTTIDCGDGMIHMGGIAPANCDHVFEALYCIKQTGGIGTKRYCSPLDLGNYCDYVKQPGDKLEYRSCVYTCTGDGCNSSTHIKPLNIYSVLGGTMILYFFTKFYIIRILIAIKPAFRYMISGVTITG